MPYHAVVMKGIPELSLQEPGTLDAVFVVGGDGTLLEVVRWMTAYGRRIPICGWNAGHVGFHMNDIPTGAPALYEALTRISNIACEVEPYELLDARMAGADRVKRHVQAFNEIAFIPVHHGQIARLDFSINGQSFGTHSGDGLIVSTSQGTTGWGVGAHGPAVDPGVAAIVLIPKDPHPAMRYGQLLFPVVLPEGTEITVRVTDPEHRPIAAITDGGEPMVITSATITMGGPETPAIEMLTLPDAEGRGRFVRRLYEKFLRERSGP